jgi:hypothetical protein
MVRAHQLGVQVKLADQERLAHAAYQRLLSPDFPAKDAEECRVRLDEIGRSLKRK